MYLLTFSGPQGIGARTNDEPLEAGVFVSDGIIVFYVQYWLWKYYRSDSAHRVVFPIVLEPGYYEDGSFGLRIESILLLKHVTLEVKVNFNGHLFNRFIFSLVFVVDKLLI